MAITNSTRRAGSLLLSVSLLIAAFMSYSFFVQPEIDMITQLRGEREAKVELLERQRTVNDQVKNLIARFKSIRNLEETVSMAIPANEDLGSLLNQLHILSQASGLRVNSIDFRSMQITRQQSTSRGTSSTLDEPQFGILEIGLGSEGGYESLKAFLRLLEKNVRVLDVGALSISPVPSATDEGIFRYTLSISAYFQMFNGSTPS